MIRLLRGAYHGAIAFALLVVAGLALDRGGVLSIDDVLKVGRGGTPAARASQATCVMPTTGTVSGLTLVQDINACYAAILTSNSGGTAPANGTGGLPMTGQMWLDTSTTPNGLRVYDGTVWEVLGYVDAATGRWTPPIGGGTNTLASATTADLWSVRQGYVSVTGTTTITALASASAIPGTLKVVRFTGALTLTHNATSLILPSAANITTAAGDSAVVLALTSTNVAVVSYSRASGQAVVNPSVAVGTMLYYAGFTTPDANYLLGYAQSVLRADYPALFTALSLGMTGTRTNGSAIITGLADTSQLQPGAAVEGTGINAAALILTVDSGTQITMTANASSSGSATVTFLPYGKVDATHFSMPDCRGRYLAGRDNMGGTAANRLDATGLGVPANLGGAGGAQVKTLIQSNLPNVGLDTQLNSSAVSVAVTDPTHLHDGGGLFDAVGTVSFSYAPGGTGLTVVNAVNASGGATTGAASTGITSAGTISNLTGFTSTLSGGIAQTAHSIVAPTIVFQCMIRAL